MYRIIQNNRKLKGKIKIIGIGAKDGPYNINHYKEAFKVKFPLFPDEDRVIHKQVGEPETPFFICIKKSDKGAIEVFNTHLGKISGAEDFINMLIDLGGLK